MPPLEFGQGAGCALVQRRTEAFTTANPGQNWYCKAAAAGSQCTYDHQAVGECFKTGPGQPSNFLNGLPFTYAFHNTANCQERPTQGEVLSVSVGART